MLVSACTHRLTPTNSINICALFTLGSQRIPCTSDTRFAVYHLTMRKAGWLENKHQLRATQAEIIPMQQKQRRRRHIPTGCPLSLLLAGFTRLRHKICLQGQSPATYSVWVIGNDNCYILNFQQRGNSVPCFSKYLLHQLGPLCFT